jgi:hypothetical protein
MRWLGIACFEIVLPNGKTLVIDPFVDDAVSSPITSDQFEGCDYLFLTHGHYDHILDAGKLAVRFNPIIYCSQLVSESLTVHLGVNSDQIRTVMLSNVLVPQMKKRGYPGAYAAAITAASSVVGPGHPAKCGLNSIWRVVSVIDWCFVYCRNHPRIVIGFDDDDHQFNRCQ